MSASWKAIADQLTNDLELTSAPVQISYLDAPPAGVPEHPRSVPSVCTFFAEGRERPFYAGTRAHEECEIGAYVLGIAPEGKLGERLMSTVRGMTEDGYLQPGEAEKIPRNRTPPNFVAYGPLGSLPVPPSNVLLFARPKAAMLAMEAAHGTVPMNGRPMCAIVPTLNRGARVAVSIGCMASRIYTQMGDDLMMVGVRGDHLEEFARSVQRIRHANQAVGTEARLRRSPSTR